MRWTLALAVVVTASIAVGLSVGGAHTSQVPVPSSRVGYHKIVITGAPLLSIVHTTSANGLTITGSDLKLQGNYKNFTIQERFGAGPTVTCQFVTQNAGRSRFSCTGLNQSTRASSTLTITVT